MVALLWQSHYFTTMNRRIIITLGWVALMLGLLAARIVYGLWGEFWFPDERQIYLIGLKYFTTGLWPYFGPDVVYTNSQIPGALQGLLVGLPLFIGKVPEAPAIFLNILTFGSLAVFAWYLCKRFSNIPRWIIIIWIITCPWTMVYGTKVVNPSYVLPFAILFFIGIFETVPFFATTVVPKSLSFFLIGLSTTAIMQLHMSWVLMVPVTLLTFYCQRKAGMRSIGNCAVFYATGCLVGALTLIPTLWVYGAGGSGGTERAIVFNPANVKEIFTVLARFLSFASYEIPYLLGASTGSRMAVVKAYIWMAPFTIILLVAGFAQVLLFIVSFFLKNNRPEWNRVRWFTLAIIILTYLSFFFSIKGPSSHTFYLLFPVAMFYSMFCYLRLFAHRRRSSIVAAVLLGSGVIFYLGLGLNNLKVRSLYVNRSLVVQAIEKKDYKILGIRRADEWGHGY